MKLTTPFSFLKDVLKNNSPEIISPDKISCSVDNKKVPVKECGFELEVEKNLSDLDFWHEQNEDGLHEDPSFVMPLYFGVAKEDADDQEIVDAAR